MASQSEKSREGKKPSSSTDSIAFDIVPPVRKTHSSLFFFMLYTDIVIFQSHSSSYTTTRADSLSQSQSFPQSQSRSNHLLSPNSARHHLPVSSTSNSHHRSQPQPQPQQQQQRQTQHVEVPTVPNSPAQSQVPLGFVPIGQHPPSAGGSNGKPIGIGGGTVHVPAFGRATDYSSGPPVIPGDVTFSKGVPGAASQESSSPSRGRSPIPVPTSSGSGVGGAVPSGDALRRVPSNSSITSTGSYSKFDRSTYLDPAYYVQEGGQAKVAGAGASDNTKRKGGAGGRK